jgi:glycosyltransferase involved in cell wall biosynthesis
MRGNDFMEEKSEAKEPRISAVVPTKNRYEVLKLSLPPLLKHGFDEVVVVDSSGESQRAKNKALCRQLGVRYYHLIGNREEARNLGVKMATGDWVSVRDDDTNLIELNMEAMRKAISNDYDFMHTPPASNCVWFFRRDFFLQIGGYDTKLCSGDDYDITMRAYKYGRALITSRDFGRTGEFEKTTKMHSKGVFSYGLTDFALFMKYPCLRTAAIIPYRPFLFLKKLAQKRTQGDFIKLIMTSAGTLFSLLYHLDSELFYNILVSD